MNKKDLAEYLRAVADNLEVDNIELNKKLMKENEFLKNMMKLYSKVIMAFQISNESGNPIKNFIYKDKFSMLKKIGNLLDEYDGENNRLEEISCVKDFYKEITHLDWDD